MLHMVITVPPYLNSAALGASSVLGSTPPIMWPSIHTRKRRGGDDENGLNILTSIIAKRSKNINKLFTPKDLRKFAVASDEEIRIMFSFVRAALTIVGAKLDRIQLPTPSDVIQQAELVDIDELPELARLFDFNLIINYRNGKDWYDILPIITDYVLERQKVLDARKPKNNDD